MVPLADGQPMRLSVWWDQALQPGDAFSPEITTALDAAVAVVVIWSEGAVASNWVYAEAVRAASQRKIVTVREQELDPARIPLPFNVFHTGIVSDVAGVLGAVSKLTAGGVSQLPTGLPGPGFRGWLLDPKQETLPARAIARRPASLLVARHRVVPFRDVHGLLDRFVAWATGAPVHAMGSPALGRLVHGPGGLGKTRLMIEVAEVLTRAHGWLAGFVPRELGSARQQRPDDAFERLILGGTDAKGLMLVVDYAEARQEDVIWLADRLVRRAEMVTEPARLVLLSRGAGTWWRELRRKSQSLQELTSLGETYDEVELPERSAAPIGRPCSTLRSKASGRCGADRSRIALHNRRRGPLR